MRTIIIALILIFGTLPIHAQKIAGKPGLFCEVRSINPVGDRYQITLLFQMDYTGMGYTAVNVKPGWVIMTPYSGSFVIDKITSVTFTTLTCEVVAPYIDTDTGTMLLVYDPNANAGRIFAPVHPTYITNDVFKVHDILQLQVLTLEYNLKRKKDG